MCKWRMTVLTVLRGIPENYQCCKNAGLITSVARMLVLFTNVMQGFVNICTCFTDLKWTKRKIKYGISCSIVNISTPFVCRHLGMKDGGAQIAKDGGIVVCSICILTKCMLRCKFPSPTNNIIEHSIAMILEYINKLYICVRYFFYARN